MSSILRALKKLEDRPTDAAGAPPWREKFASEHARHSRSPRAPWRRTPVIAAGAVALLAAGWLMNRRPPADEKTIPSVTRSERQGGVAQSPTRGPAGTAALPTAGSPSLPQTGDADAAPPPFIARIQEAQQRPREALQTGRTPTPGVTPPLGPQGRATAAPALPPPQQVAPVPSMAPVSAPAPDRDDAPDAQPAAAEAASNDAGPVTPDRRAPPPDRPPQPTRTAAAIPTTQATTPAQRPLRAALSPPQKDLAAPTEPTLTRLRDDAVKLQAVAWSSDPERRMAVINEQVVREGYTIEGYTIATIREESVIVRKGAESWELRYGH